MIGAVTSRWKGLRDLYRWHLVSTKHFISHLTTESDLSHPLIGPPEIYLPNTPAEQWLVGSSECQSLLNSSSFCNKKLPPKPPIGQLKVNHSSLLFPSSGNPCLDFFTYLSPKPQLFYLENYLKMAWNHDPLTTLKIICFWRGARENGKPKRKIFYQIAMWLHQNHPKTLAYNLKTFAKYGYLKDLLEILYRVLKFTQVREITGKDMKKRLKKTEVRLRRLKLGWRNCKSPCRSKYVTNNSSTANYNKKNLFGMVKIQVEADMAVNMRRKRAIAMAKEIVDNYNNNPNYQFLHDLISDIFAQHLKSDLELLKHGNISNISQAAKWCPSLNSSYDGSTLICESIARRVFPRESDPEYKEIEEAHYAYRIRDRLRKQVLVPLRKALKIPETYEGTDVWYAGRIRRYQVSYVAMIKYNRQWCLNVGWPARNFLERDLGHGRVFLFPHNLVSIYYETALFDWDIEMIERRWREMVECLVKKGKFGSCLAVCWMDGVRVPYRVILSLH